eukprot:g40144.t1
MSLLTMSIMLRVHTETVQRDIKMVFGARRQEVYRHFHFVCLKKLATQTKITWQSHSPKSSQSKKWMFSRSKKATDELFAHLEANGSMDQITDIMRRAKLGELKDAPAVPAPAPDDPAPDVPIQPEPAPTPADPAPEVPVQPEPAPAPDPADPDQSAPAPVPAPGQPAPAPAPAPAPDQPAPADPVIPGPWVKYENIPTDTKYFVVQLSLGFVMADKKAKMARKKSEMKSEPGHVYCCAEVDSGILNPVSQQFFIASAGEGENEDVSIFPSLTSIHKKYRSEMKKINYILPISGNWKMPSPRKL